MMNIYKIQPFIKIIWHFNRIILGMVFIFSGIVKAIDPMGTQYKIEDYLQAFGHFFTFFSPFSLFFAFMLITIEFTLGICLLCSVCPKIVSWLTFLFYAVMLPLTLYIAIQNPVSDCGCFGDALVITNWQTFYKNLILISFCIVNLIILKYVRDIFITSHPFLVILISFMLICSFMFWTVKHLPVIDFRPYKIGNNIIQLMEYPEDAKPDKYEISFVYEKNGKKQVFTLDDYPKNDSTWHFVNQQSKLIEKGYEPPIHDFELLDLNYNNLTYDILESPTPVTLVIMYALDKSDKKQFVKLDSLYQLCMRDHRTFYIVTGGSKEQIEDFCNNLQSHTKLGQLAFIQESEKVFLMCDPITLKTIVRANPGVVIIQNGTIIDKYNLNNK